MTANPPPLFVSACLLGVNCRYDARPLVARGELLRMIEERRAVAFCPEEAGGLSTPREPSSIEPGFSGEDVLDGRARVLTASGRDVTAEFLAGAQAALDFARAHGCTRALLKARSPSCAVGSLRLLDGGLAAGDGVTAALFRRSGIAIEAMDAARR